MYEPIKKLGQNFLGDNSIISLMVEALSLADEESVVEIGPGLGALTLRLAEKMDGIKFELFAVEIDERFADKLLEMFVEYPDLNIIQSDILTWLPGYTSDRPIKIIGSLPFYITSPILHAIIKMQKLPKVCVLLTQKEVAEKIASTAPDASYLSVFVNTFFNSEMLQVVPKGSFTPVPEVDGAVIKLIRNNNYLPPDRIQEYENFLHRGFRFPRKMLNKVFRHDFLGNLEVSPSSRPHDIGVDKWLRMFAAEREGKKGEI